MKTLVSSMASGNCCVMKCSEQSPKSEELMVKLIPKYLDTSAFRVVTGGPAESERLLKVASFVLFAAACAALTWRMGRQVQWDFIVFTGSQRVAKFVQSQRPSLPSFNAYCVPTLCSVTMFPSYLRTLSASSAHAICLRFLPGQRRVPARTVCNVRS